MQMMFFIVQIKGLKFQFKNKKSIKLIDSFVDLKKYYCQNVEKRTKGEKEKNEENKSRKENI